MTRNFNLGEYNRARRPESPLYADTKKLMDVVQEALWRLADKEPKTSDDMRKLQALANLWEVLVEQAKEQCASFTPDK